MVLDCSTIAPDTARRSRPRWRSAGRRRRRARVGRLGGSAQGPADRIRRRGGRACRGRRPALEAFCKSITHLGGPGAGQAGKAVNQVLISGTYAALGEGLALGEKEGLPLEALVEALSGGAAGSWILQNRSANVINGSYPLGFRMELHLKDLRIALAEADRLGLPMEVTRLVTEQAQRLVDAGYGGEDSSSLRARGARRDRLDVVIERYLQIRAATVAGHLPSGELGYLADVTGLLQLWRVAPDGLHEQVTFAGERVTAALASPSEERWVIARDAGGNERHALFAIDASGSSELPLSDDADAIHVPGAFSPDGPLLAFTHTGRNGVDFDVAVVPARVASGASWRSPAAGRTSSTGRGTASSCSAPTRRSTTTSSSSIPGVARSSRSPHTTTRSPSTRRACCRTAPCSAPAMRAASSRAWRCCARAPDPSC